MEKRFGAAVLTAVVLHAALLGLTLLSRHSAAPRGLDAGVEASAAEVELTMLTGDDGPSFVGDGTSSTNEPSDRTVRPQARVAQLRALSRSSGPAPGGDSEVGETGTPVPDAGAGAGLAELEPGAEPGSSSHGASEPGSRVRPRIDLGLEGSVLRHAALEARKRAPRRRPSFSLGGWWSENVVRSVAQKSAPWEGSSLLTLEWDSTGQLRSVTSSAASSRGDEWERLAKGLSSQLAARPNVAAQGAGLRLVYLVKSELVLPESKRSLLPAAKYAAVEQLRADNLPPATTLMLGVKADDSAATTRVVSVQLVRSEAP